MREDVVDSIKTQKKQVFSNDFYVELHEACSIDKGIMKLNDDERARALDSFVHADLQPSFFIPASGSGSRMFKFLFEYLESGVESEMSDTFFNSLSDFPFFYLFKEHGVNTENRKEVADFILNELELANYPKGLIPFHRYASCVRTAFQDQIIQASNLLEENAVIEFSVQEQFEAEIAQNIQAVLKDTGAAVKYSYQDKETDAYCFDNNGDVVMEGDTELRRPAGHGALLGNLNEIQNDVILVKNIDNLQHNSLSNETSTTWKLAMGVLLNFKKELTNLISNYSFEQLEQFNHKYQLFHPSLIGEVTLSDVQELGKRPSRVCGMVKNEGEPGGGPFWIKQNGEISKQIVEKAQIKSEPDQVELVKNSSHFNPVFLVISKCDLDGNQLDLMNFRDDSTYFVVEKTHKGKPIKYRELPGLWNGSMSKWNTIFLEIPSSVFSPVKTVLDLCGPAHKVD